MTIDHPQVRHIPTLTALWQEAFGDRETFIEGFFRTGFSPARSRCLWLEDRLAAALYWFDCRWAEKKLAYIYAVATDKAYRGRGLCTRLMEDTHGHLRALGYAGAILVPGNEKLFALYGGMGYRPCCPIREVTVTAAGTATLHPVNPDTYAALRQGLLPPGGVLQTGAALDYLATFAKLYRGEGFLTAVTPEGETAWFQEFLGAAQQLPGVVVALGCREGKLRLPGQTPGAMYLPLDGTETVPGYFGISLG